jgi:hypothetical protein
MKPPMMGPCGGKGESWVLVEESDGERQSLIGNGCARHTKIGPRNGVTELMVMGREISEGAQTSESMPGAFLSVEKKRQRKAHKARPASKKATSALRSKRGGAIEGERGKRDVREYRTTEEAHEETTEENGSHVLRESDAEAEEGKGGHR